MSEAIKATPPVSLTQQDSKAVIFNPVPGDPPLCTFYMSPLFNTGDSDPQVIR